MLAPVAAVLRGDTSVIVQLKPPKA